MVLVSRHLYRYSRFDRAVWLTLLAAVVAVAGMLWQSGNWVLGAPPSGIVYIAWDGVAYNQLFLLDPDADDPPLRLTDESTDVADFAVSPDGRTVVYTRRRGDGLGDLWLVGTNGRLSRPLLTCDDALCSQPRWSPDGTRLVYERRSVAAPGAPPGSPRLWWVDMATGDTTAVFSDTQWLGWGAAFSPNGRWLSYVSPNAQEVQAYNLQTGQTVRIPSRSGEPGVWDTQGESLLVTDVLLDGEQFALHLFAVDLATETAVDLSGTGAEVNDSLPAVSPDGRWIAITRKVPRSPDGKQVWLLPRTGGELINLTNRPEVHFGMVGWSENGRYLTFQGYELARPGAEPTIWLYDTTTSELRSLITPGTQPTWVP
ncbi:MAG: hypothetical protein R3C62_11670 [Chloroflexota bacterium]